MNKHATKYLKMIDLVADYYNLKREDVLSKHRGWVKVRARWIITYILVRRIGLQHQEAAQVLGCATSNINYSLASCEEQCSVDKSFKQQLELLSAYFEP